MRQLIAGGNAEFIGVSVVHSREEKVLSMWPVEEWDVDSIRSTVEFLQGFLARMDEDE